MRKEDPGLGQRKLWLMGTTTFGDRMIGRDAFYALLEREGLRLARPKPRHTTRSNHRFHKWKNLIKGYVPMGPNLLWVSDITYIPMASGRCCYLHLVTDAYSHMVVGWCVSETLAAENTLQALRDAIKQADGYDLSRLIHHSDRGIQYCCDAYVNELQQHGVSISMTEDYKPTDNAIAERVNGIIKREKIYCEDYYQTLDEARDKIGHFITFYNTTRIHASIGYQTPLQAHSQTGPQTRMWHSNYSKGSQPGTLE